MIIAALDALVVFSGLPTGWKKGIVLAFSIILILIGWMIRTIEKRRTMRAKARAQSIETEMAPDIERVATTIAHDVQESVEQEISHLEHSTYESNEV
ncbi:MAG: hypothetical protein JWM20_740 [Patescibacteria group bacterium]|nr:hypothetical protein [Patescibacteria group bacterium]